MACPNPAALGARASFDVARAGPGASFRSAQPFAPRARRVLERPPVRREDLSHGGGAACSSRARLAYGRGARRRIWRGPWVHLGATRVDQWLRGARGRSTSDHRCPHASRPGERRIGAMSGARGALGGAQRARRGGACGGWRRDRGEVRRACRCERTGALLAPPRYGARALARRDQDATLQKWLRDIQGGLGAFGSRAVAEPAIGARRRRARRRQSRRPRRFHARSALGQAADASVSGDRPTVGGRRDARAAGLPLSVGLLARALRLPDMGG
jgi:hypothetical protein